VAILNDAIEEAKNHIPRASIGETLRQGLDRAKHLAARDKNGSEGDHGHDDEHEHDHALRHHHHHRHHHDAALTRVAPFARQIEEVSLCAIGAICRAPAYAPRPARPKLARAAHALSPGPPPALSRRTVATATA
jgi:hypothetical protein